MKAKQVNELAEELLQLVLNPNARPIKTSSQYDWQNVDVLESDSEREELADNVNAEATIYSTGSISLSVTFMPNNPDTKQAVLAALNRLKAKNLIGIAVDCKIESQAKECEANELLNVAAGMLGIPVEQLKEEGAK